MYRNRTTVTDGETQVSLPFQNGQTTETATPTTDGQPPTAATEAPPKWFVEHQANNAKSIQSIRDDLARWRAKSETTSKKGSTKESTETPTVAGPEFTHEDARAALKLGEVKARLPESARKRIDEMIDSGKRYSDVLPFAETIAEFSPSAANAEHPAGMAPIGTAASAAPRTSPTWPQDQESLFKLKTENPKQYAELMSAGHPFDPSKLPFRRRP